MIHILRATAQFLLQLPVMAVMALLGLFVVPIAINFSRTDVNFEGRVIDRLPQWALWWDNIVDGTLGDDQDKWAQKRDYKQRSYASRFRWMAVRNPANYFKRFVMAVDVSKETPELIYGQEYVRDDFRSTGWQLLKAGNYYTFYYVRRWGKTNNAVVIQLGNKFRLENKELGLKRFKGATFEVNPYKDIS